MKVASAPLLVLVLVACPCHALRELETPISRVVKLLKDISAKTEKQGRVEEELYEKFACWAKNVIDTKTASNVAATSRIDTLSTYIADVEAGRVEFTSERVDLEKEIKEITTEVDSATAMHKEETKQFEAASGEMTKALDALDRSVDILNDATKDHKTGTFFAQRAEVRSSQGFAARMHDAEALEHAVELGQRLLSAGDAIFLRRLLSGDVPKQDWKKLNRKPTFKSSYKARSFNILNVLKKLHQTFQRSLKDAEKKNKDSTAKYDKLMKTKQGQLKEAQTALEKMEAETGAKQMSKEEATEELQALQKQVENDKKFIAQTKQALEDKKQEYKERKELRTGELAALSKATQILYSDDARDLAKSSYNSQGYLFLQEGTKGRASSAAVQQLSSAIETLRQTARSAADGRLAALAARIAVKNAGHFDEVITSLEAMLERLQEEEDEDLTNKEQCEKERADDAREAITGARAIDDITDEMVKLKGDIEDIVEDIKEKEGVIKEIKKMLAEATKDRKEENEEWKQSDSDDKKMKSIVLKAKEVLKKFYADNNLMLVQEPGKAPPPPPATFESPYEGSSKASMGVIGHLEIIVKDLEKDIFKAKEEEDAAQAKYDKFKEESDDQVTDLEKDITDLGASKSTKEETLADEKSERLNKKGSLDAVTKKIEDANEGCEYVTVNYPTRLKNRQIEMDGLRKAKAILSGAKFDAPDPNRELKPGDAFFLQQRPHLK